MLALNRRFVVAVFTMFVVPLALAATAVELLVVAQALHADYESLESEVVACPDGACTGAAAIVADFALLEQRRLQLVADRTELSEPCNCQELDSTIADVNALAYTIGRTLGGWHDGQ